MKLTETHTKNTAEYLTCDGWNLEGITYSREGGSLIFAEAPGDLRDEPWVEIMVGGDAGILWTTRFKIELHGKNHKAGKVYNFLRTR